MRGCWCNVTVLNAQALTKVKNSDSKDSVCEEL